VSLSHYSGKKVRALKSSARIVAWMMITSIAIGGGARGENTVKPLTKITFVQEWPVADGFWIPWTLGRQRGFYAEEGIDLEILAPPTLADTMKFLGTGRADVAFTTVMDIVFAREQGAKVVAIGRYGRGNNWGIFGKAGAEMTVSSLKAKTIGIYNDAWTKAQLSLVLRSAGLTLNDVTTVAASDDTVPLLLRGKVDAITGLTNAEGSELKTFGEKNRAFIAATDHGVPNIPIFMLAGNEEWLAKNPTLARAFLRATHKSIAYAVSHPAEGPEIFAKVYSKAYDPAYIEQQWADTIPQFGGTGNDLMKLNQADWIALLKAVRDLGLIQSNIPPERYYTNAFIENGEN
jgi:putative hydroxymethylpyrimidine transport system substrate-binding protein